MSNEVYFELNGHINKQNNMQYWSDLNPLQIHQKPLHSRKVTVFV